MSAPHNASKSGIALIIVLGFLALLTLMAVSFSIEMRTERLVSSVYTDAGEARHFIDVALARAMEDVDNDLIDAGLNAPDWFYFDSVNNGSQTNSTQLYDGEARSYVPKFIDGEPADSDFILIPDPSGTNGPPIGRYAYLVVNQTGLLDLNEVGKSTNRAEGRSPGEIQITDELNPEVSSLWPDFPAALSNTWRRIETMNEFAAISGANLASGIYSVGLYSRSLIEPDPDGRSKYYLTSASRLITDADEVIDRLVQCGYSRAEAGLIFTNLVDFLDTDYEPFGGLDSYCGEPVPFINEIIFSNQATRAVVGSVTNIRYEVFVTVEVWNPFTNAYSFNLDYDPTAITFPINLVIPPTSPTVINMNGVVPTRTPPPGTAIDIGPGAFALIEYRFTNETAIVPPLNGVGTGINLGGAIDLQLVQANNAVVDRVDLGALAGSPIQLAITGFNTAAPGATVPGRIFASLSIDDPRLNHTPGRVNPDQAGWSLGSGPAAANVASPGAVNNRTFQAAGASGEGVFNPGARKLPGLYVHNRPFSATSPPGDVGLLGYVGTGEPWRTIPLYDHPDNNGFDLNRVLDYFAVGSPGPIRGQVSVNTLYTNALSSVLINVPVNGLPGADPEKRLTQREIISLVRDMMEYSRGTGGITNLSVLGSGQILSPQFFQNTLSGHDTDDLRESIIRNTIGLLTVRQNLFAIIVEAQVLGEPDPDTNEQPVIGVSRALAHVWRDPFPDGNGLYPMYIRHFMYLDENF